MWNKIIFSKLFPPSSISRLKYFCLKLFQNILSGLLQLMNIFQHVQCRWNNFAIISVIYFTCNHSIHTYECTISHLPHLPTLPPPVTAKQRVVIIPEDQPEEGIDGYGGKDFEKRKVLRWEWKTPRERSSGSRSEYDDGEELGDDERLDW